MGTEVTSRMLLADGDRITLYTGAIDGTLDGQGSLGKLYWDFSCESPSSCPPRVLDAVPESNRQPTRCVQNAPPTLVPPKEPSFSGPLTASTGNRGWDASPPCQAAKTVSTYNTSSAWNRTKNHTSHPGVVGALQAPLFGFSLDE